MYTLFYSPGSCSLAPHIILEELGVPYQGVLISTKDGQQHSDEYKKINPRRRVPAFQVGESILTECVAILSYLADTHPEKNLLPTDHWARAQALSLGSFFTSSIHAGAAAGVFRPERFTDDEAARKTVAKKSLVTFQGYMGEIDTMLQTKTYLLGEEYSILDPYALVFFRWGNRMKLDMSGLFPAYHRHAQLMLTRPAVQRVLEREGISLWDS
jgi:glutathione S-transferase